LAFAFGKNGRHCFNLQNVGQKTLDIGQFRGLFGSAEAYEVFELQAFFEVHLVVPMVEKGLTLKEKFYPIKF
jgi:hypothetical protein